MSSEPLFEPEFAVLPELVSSLHPVAMNMMSAQDAIKYLVMSIT